MKARLLGTLALAGAFLAASLMAPLAAAAQGPGVRPAILNALRQELKARHGLEAVFTVKHLKAKDGWAWVAVLPRSPDGKSRYEPVAALLQEKAGAWKVVEMRPGGPDCEEDPDCADDARYFRKLRSRFPQVPAEIFPK